MKTFINKTTSIQKSKSDASQGHLDYRQLALECLEVVPQGGFKLRDLDIRLKIKRALEDTESNEFKLEDEQAEELLKCILEMPWAMLHEDILSFVQDTQKQLS